MGVYWVTGGILLAYLVVIWLLSVRSPLHGSDRWILFGGLAFIGVLAAGTILWFHRRSQAKEVGRSGGPESSGIADIDLLVQEALRRLKGSPLGRGATLRSLPLVFLVGDSGATKTTTILHSALDPELLAGHVSRDDTILPTRVLNIWYTRQAIFVDVAGGLLAQPARWKRLVKLVQPGRIFTAVGRGQQAPRAAIVCFDCGNFLQPGASESTMSTARKFATRLQEVSHLLSISFPVYVLFTKLDKVTFFTEFARGLSQEEAAEVLGVTLPVRSSAAGVYAEEETRRLTKAFDEIFYSLAEKRLDLLAREFESDKLPGIYEFPRELRKLRTLLVQFLVDLARPSQLSVNPFLRGFYFSGVRPVIVGDVVPAAPPVQSSEAMMDGGATRIFHAGGPQVAQAAAPARAGGSRKVPQWVFLTQLFNNVIVKDRVALAASGFSTRVNLLRRVAMALVIAAGMVCAIGFLVSFLGNHRLESNVRTALREAETVQPPPASQLPSLGDLRKLDVLRRELVTLSQYQKVGPPLSLRWGLYVGGRIYPDAKKVYFERLAQLLFNDTQARLLSALQNLPAKPGSNEPNDRYEETYKDLKAYLITTSNHEKSSREFLAPVLADRWSAGRNIDPERVGLATQQFDFYSTELAASNPYSSANDSTAISHARSYLSQFGGTDRFYVPLLGEASRKNLDVSFNRQFPDSRDVIDSSYTVRGAFTPGGFAFMQGAIRNSSNYIHGEEWVLGKVVASDLDEASLQQKLTERYHQDFIEQWRNVLQRSKVRAYTNLADASHRLDRLTNPSSPLLEFLWFVSNHTNVDAADISGVFRPVQLVAPPGPADRTPDQFVDSPAKAYIDALFQLRSDIDTALQSPTGPGDPALLNQISRAEGEAEGAARRTIGGAIDQKFHTENEVYRMLAEPITNVRNVATGVPVEALNVAGQGFCSQFAQISGKYPFNPNSTQDAPIDQVNSIFAPRTGALWTFYDKLKQYLPAPGPPYSPLPGGTVRLNQNFVQFFNHAAAFSKAMYGSDSQTPRFSYTLTEMPSNVEKLALRIGTETVSGTGTRRTLTWNGAPDEHIEVVKGGETLKNFTGPWSIFRFASSAPKSETSTAGTTLEWRITQNDGSAVLLNGKPEFYSYQLLVNGFNPFGASEWTGLRCVAQVAHSQ
jgi:type VI secretion system protein ImpL